MRFCRRKIYHDVLDFAYTSRLSRTIHNDKSSETENWKHKSYAVKILTIFAGCVSQEYGTEFEADSEFKRF